MIILIIFTMIMITGNLCEEPDHIHQEAVCDSTQNVGRYRYFFPVLNIFDTDTGTFFRYQIFTIPVPRLIIRPSSLQELLSELISVGNYHNKAARDMVRLCNCICHFVLGSQLFKESLNIYLTCQGRIHLSSGISWLLKVCKSFWIFPQKRWMIYNELWSQRRLVLWSRWMLGVNGMGVSPVER